MTCAEGGEAPEGSTAGEGAPEPPAGCHGPGVHNGRGRLDSGSPLSVPYVHADSKAAWAFIHL